MQTELATEILNGRWRLDRRLGAGADATLYAATDLRTQEKVALKLLHAALDEKAQERLRWEFAVLAGIEHPHLVRVFDLDRAAGRPFFTAELLAGAAPTRLAMLPPPERARQLCQLLAEVGSALEALHRRGLIHHDIKPSNLLTDSAGCTRLGDLGLAALRGAAGGVRGTPAYLAPEALGGSSEARTDLYALGATAWALWHGRPPFPGDELGAVLRAVQTTIPAPLSDAPEGLRALVERLLAREPAQRPSSAHAVVEEARRLGARLDGKLDHGRAAPLLSGPALVGRERELAALCAALTPGVASPHLVLVEGVAGAGRSRLIEEARRRLQLDAVARGEQARSWSRLESAHATAVVARLAAGSAILHVPQVSESEVERLLALAAHGAAAPSQVVAEVEPESFASVHGDGVLRLRLGPLGVLEIERLCASMLGEVRPGLASAVHRASGGLPRLAVELVRAAAARAQGTPDADEIGRLQTRELSALLTASMARLAPAAQRLLEALAVLGRPAALEEVVALCRIDTQRAWEAAGEARAAGLLELEDARLCFPSVAHAAAAQASLSPAQLRTLHRRALARTPPSALVDRAHHLVALEEPEAAETALKAGQVLADRGALRQSRRLLEAAERLASGPARLRARLQLAQTCTMLGDYDAALGLLLPLEATSDPSLQLEAAIVAARALQRSGDLPAAEARLRPLLAAEVSRAATPRARDDVRALLGRILIARGAYAQATEVCASAETGSLEVAEARGLGGLYLGQLEAADAAFAALEAAAEGQPGRLARAHSLRGMVAQSRDDLAAAAARYAEALALARDTDDLHGAAIYAANLGAVLREQGDYQRALEPTADAARDLGRLGKRAERSFALFNYGNLLLSIGDLEGAERAAGEAEALARAAGAHRELGYAHLLTGDLRRRRGQHAAAIEQYRFAAATLSQAAPGDRLATALNLAEALAEAGDAQGARGALSEARPLAEEANQVDTWVMTAARVMLGVGDPLDPRCFAELERVRERAARATRRDRAFRAEVLLARGAIRTERPRHALLCLQRARALWQEIRMRTPELRRDSLDEDPDARRLQELLAAASPPERAPVAPSAAALRKLLALNKRLNSELRLSVLLDLILDTVLELTSAERGFVLLTAGEGQWKVEAARNIAIEPSAPPPSRSAADPPPMDAPSFSRSIAERAARQGLPIVTLDASGDDRFEAALSVSDLKLRSVLAVPLAVKGRVVGCVYADHRLRAGAFGDAEVALVCDLAEQAAIAVENARLMSEFAEARRHIDELNRELERKLASQAVELNELHKEVRSSRAALTIRYNYDNLIGRTPRMLDLFRLLDRVTDTSLPVVIYGESGTGKELVARAIHHNGPRRARPFVSESCAAIPETLLEAALFGHVRGAFTGAETERRGLFEVADGGTLFLDEVGEMPPAMQSKLLRVLQLGEFRRVGGEKIIKVAVRVLVASNRDLGRLVQEGKFREDLFYRLNVVRVALPPLRERRDDIPLLVEHFLTKFADEQQCPPRQIARAALQKLCSYRWPGNVRELENEVVRAASLGGEVISVADLSSQVAAGDPEAALDSPDDLSLKQRVERLERTLIREALYRTNNNQTQSARLLGLSRYGLQKKLQRYGIDT